jgi:hypothetical protein
MVGGTGIEQWPLPCETGAMGLQINDMRAASLIATGACYHVVSLGITQRHERTVPKLSQHPLSHQSEANDSEPPPGFANTRHYA